MTTKDWIIQEARGVFEKFGYTKTSMADIARAARRGRRTLYMHFAGKEEVFRAVIEVEVNALAEKLGAIIEGEKPPSEKLREYMHVRMNAVKELTMYYDAMRQDMMMNLGLIEKIRKRYDFMEKDMIRRVLDEGVACGEFHIGDTALLAGAIVMATKGFELPIYMGDQDFDHIGLIDPLIGLFFRGIAKC